jgi:hypothetical protein
MSSTSESIAPVKQEHAVVAIVSRKPIDPANQREKASPTMPAPQHAVTAPRPAVLRDMGPIESITDLSMYTLTMPRANLVSETGSMKENDVARPTLHLQASTKKNILMEIELNNIFKPGAQRSNVPVLSRSPEDADESAPPVSPHAHEIETGNFPLKLTMLYPTDPDFCYSQSSESGENVCLLQRWMDFIQPPPNHRQASLGDSLLLPPAGRPNPVPTDTVNKNIEYIPPKLSLSHNVTESSIATDTMEDSEGGQSWYFRSDVSAITFGSEFEALLRTKSLPQLTVPSTCTSSGDRVHHQTYQPVLEGYQWI